MPAREGFVPEGFAVPEGLSTPVFRLVPLGPEHNISDHDAWSASIEHIRATPGYERRAWPPAEGMTLEENLADLERQGVGNAGKSRNRGAHHIKPVGTGKQSLARLPLCHLALQLSPVPLGHIGKIRDDKVKSLSGRWQRSLVELDPCGEAEALGVVTGDDECQRRGVTGADRTVG